MVRPGRTRRPRPEPAPPLCCRHRRAPAPPPRRILENDVADLYQLSEGLVAEEIDDDVALRARGQFDTMPLIRGGLLSDDDRLAALPITLDLPDAEIDGMRRAVESIRGVVARRPPPEGYQARLTGLPVLRVEIVNDLAITEPFPEGRIELHWMNSKSPPMASIMSSARSPL